MDQLPWLGKRELICLLSFACNYVVFVWRGFLFLWVLGMGYVILLWHSLSLPYNYLTSMVNSRGCVGMFSNPNHTFPGQAYPKRLTSTQCSSFHQYRVTRQLVKACTGPVNRTCALPKASCANQASDTHKSVMQEEKMQTEVLFRIA